MVFSLVLSEYDTHYLLNSHASVRVPRGNAFVVRGFAEFHPNTKVAAQHPRVSLYRHYNPKPILSAQGNQS